MRAQHDRRLLRRRQRHHPEVPGHVAQRVGDVADDLAGEALVAVGIGQAEGDGAGRVGDDGPVPPVPAVGPAVQGVDAGGVRGRRVLVGQDVVRLAVDHEARVLDPVRVAAGHAAEVRVLAVHGVVGGVVEAAHDVALHAGRVVDEQVGDGRAVGDEVGADADAADLVLAVLVGPARRARNRRVARRAGDDLAGDLGESSRERREGDDDAGRLPEHVAGSLAEFNWYTPSAIQRLN